MAIEFCKETLHLRVGADSAEWGGIILRCENHQGDWHVAYLDQAAVGIVLRRGVKVIKWQ